MHRIRAITLDLDDTLWAIAPVIRRAEQELWQWLADNYPNILQQHSSESLRELRDDVMMEYRDRCHDFRFLRKKVLECVALSSGYSAELVEPAFAVFQAARNRVEFFPDAIPALERLHVRFTIVAVTNGNADLAAIGISHLFHDIVTAVDAGTAKPSLRIFETAMQRAGVTAEEILHVGDHPEIDIDGARNAGMRTAWVNRHAADWPVHLKEPDHEVQTMDDVEDLLQHSRGKV